MLKKTVLCLFTLAAIGCTCLYLLCVHLRPLYWERDFVYTWKPENNGNCVKSSPSSTYKVCKKLPYTEIKCGDANTNISALEKHYVVPNVAFFVWFAYERTFQYYNYLALRSVASVQRPAKIKFYYSEGLPIGKHWDRAVREIRCLETIKIEEPTHALGVKMPDVVRRTDLARLNILIESGGVYLDGDVITLRSYDPLRLHPTTVGRSTKICVCLCVVLAKKNSLFLREFYKEFPRHFDYARPSSFTTLYLKTFVENTKVQVHLEESSINRPSPHVREDKLLSTTLGHIDISDNYFLHIHPKRFQKAIDPDWVNWDVEVIRTLDGVYGDAARIALFGSPALIFKPGEKTFEMKKKKKIYQFEPILQRNAIIQDN